MHKHHVKCYDVKLHLLLQEFTSELGLWLCKMLFLLVFFFSQTFFALSPIDHLLNLLFVSPFLLGPSDRQACQIHFLIKAV